MLSKEEPKGNYGLIIIPAVFIYLFINEFILNPTKNNFKTEYEVELVDQDSIRIYSVSNDTVYNCLYTEMEKIIELDNLQIMESKINKAVYGITENSPFGLRIIAGIVTGVSYTEEHSPRYEITFGKNRVWVNKIAESKTALVELLQLPDLQKVAKENPLTLKKEQL